MNEEPPAGASQASPADLNADCPRCLKPQALCVCEGIAPIDNKVSLLILQHPQEQDRELGTARLTVLHLKDALLKIGLSWPSLTRILGRPAALGHPLSRFSQGCGGAARSRHRSRQQEGHRRRSSGFHIE
jgi:DTW domain-containing protein